jgi:hypothetical protein
LSLRAKVLDAQVNGQKVSPSISHNENDQHLTVAAAISTDRTALHLRVSGDFGIGYPFAAAADGAVSSGLKIVSEQWNDAHNEMLLQVAGVNGKTYEVPIFNVPSGIRVEGAIVTKTELGLTLEISFRPGEPMAYATRTVTLQFPAQ